MKRLNPPYGYNEGIGVTLYYNGKFEDFVDKKEFQLILLGFSCHHPAIDKIYNSLRYSGEYTCFLQQQWVKNSFFELEKFLKTISIDVIIFFFMDEKTKKELLSKYNDNNKKFSRENEDDEKYLQYMIEKHKKIGYEYFNKS